MFEVNYYRLEDGSCPIEKYLENLPIKMKAKVFRTIALLEQFGNQLREPYSKALVDGIFELRIKQGTDIERVLYFFYAGNQVVLTNGFTKKQMKTPKAEIELAKKRKADYMRRNLHERF